MTDDVSDVGNPETSNKLLEQILRRESEILGQLKAITDDVSAVTSTTDLHDKRIKEYGRRFSDIAETLKLHQEEQALFRNFMRSFNDKIENHWVNVQVATKQMSSLADKVVSTAKGMEWAYCFMGMSFVVMVVVLVLSFYTR